MRKVKKIKETQEFSTVMFVVRKLINEEIVPIFEYYKDVHMYTEITQSERENDINHNRGS